jgi:dTDP-4-amino-4,6-dideoxygalactose transaminase
MDEIMKWAQQRNVKVVEDNAQAQGATWNDKATGSWGHLNATSFYPGKNLGALGDAGAITTNDTNLYESAKVIRNYGSRVKYDHEICGMNSRLDEIQAAFLALKLESLPEWNLERKRIASAYDKALNELTELKTLQVPRQSSPVYHLYVVRCQNRLALQENLSAQGIQTLIHYPIPLHKQRCFEVLKLASTSVPNAEQWAATCLSLPIYPGLTTEQQSLVINSVHSHFGSRISVTAEDVERLRAH